MNKRMIIMLVVTGLVFGGIFGFKWFGNKMMNQFFDNMPMPPVAITATEAQEQTWPATIDAVGTVTPVNGIAVTSEVAGAVESIRFRSGDRVAAGAVLVTLDAVVDQAELRTLNAQHDLAESELARGRELFGSDVMAKSQLDRLESEAAQAAARVAAKQALIAKKTIRAPFSGVLGIKQISLGQYVSPGTPLVTLQSLDPIYVNFSLPEQRLGVLTVGTTVTAGVDAFPDAAFKGRITAIEPRVDENTRNFNVQATFGNADVRLQPGLFARVQIALAKSDTYVVVPQTAVSYNPYGNSVYVVQEAAASAPGGANPSPADGAAQAGPDAQGPTLVVTRRLVKTGPTRGDFVAVIEGLKPGERVATSGLLKLRNDAVVVVNNKVTPAADIRPSPPES
ncbi:MAG: efflux RND transporter periplasmic adaptor subunit [Nitrospirota bacterium]